MEYRILTEAEVPEAAALAANVFAWTLRPSMTQMNLVATVEQYLSVQNLMDMVRQEKLVLWGVWSNQRLAAVSGMQREGHITMLYVLPEYQKRGIGRKLLKTMRKYAFSHYHYLQVTLNALPAWTWKYFQRCGFRIIHSEDSMAQTAQLCGFESMTAKSIREVTYPQKKLSENSLFFILLGFFVLIIIIAVVFCVIYFS